MHVIVTQEDDMGFEHPPAGFEIIHSWIKAFPARSSGWALPAMMRLHRALGIG